MVAIRHFYVCPIDPSWPVHDLWPHQFTNFSRVLPTKFSHHRAYLNNDPNLTGWPLHNLWPHQCTALQSRVLHTEFRCHRVLLSNLTPDWPLKYSYVADRKNKQNFADSSNSAGQNIKISSCRWWSFITSTSQISYLPLIYRWATSAIKPTRSCRW